MNWLAAICVKRPVFATVLVLVMLVFGIVGYLSLGVDQFPKVDFPTVTIMTRQIGAAPENIETNITEKIEEEVNTISGIDELRSISAQGVSLVYATFVLEKDPDVAAQEVRDRVNRVLPNLPHDVDQPTVEKMDPDASPIVTVAVSAPAPLREITEYCDKKLRRRLETVAGVGQVKLIGGQSRQINVQLDPLKVRGYNLTVADVVRALATQNLEVPGGSVKMGDREFTVRTLGRVEQALDLKDISVASQHGRTITIGDLGTVEDGTAEMESMAVFGEGKADTASVLLNIRKQSGTNTVEIARQIRERLDELEKTKPAGYRIQVVRDQSVFIEAATDAVKEHLVLGAFLAGIVVLFFLANLRATIIAGLAIPTSIVTTFAVMSYMNFTLNMISLLALTLSVGIVIDDAIVVMENIFRFIDEKKCKPFDAAIGATKEIGLAVLSITLSLVAVFLPIAFMTGIVGRFLKCFGITIAATVVVSMIVSFTLTPMISARWFKAAGTEDSKHGHGGKAKWLVFYSWIEDRYRILLDFCLRHRWVVVTAAAASLLAIVPLLMIVRVNFVPDDDSAQFEINVRAPEGTSLEQTRSIMDRIAREVREVSGVRYTIASVGADEQHTANKGTVYVRLVDLNQRRFSQMEAIEFVRKNVVPGYVKNDKLRLNVGPVSAFSGGGMTNADISYLIGGRDTKMLEKYSKQVVEYLKSVPGVADVDTSLNEGKPEFPIEPLREKSYELGVSVYDAADTIYVLFAGKKVTDYNEDGEQYEVRLRASPEFRNRIDLIEMVNVPSTKYGRIPLGDVVRFNKGVGPSQIDRLNRTRQVTITANLEKGASQRGVLEGLNEFTKNLKMGPEYTSGYLGRSKEMARMIRGFVFVVFVSFVFVYLVIAAQFESWIHPVTILLSLPLTVPFALVSLLIFNQSLNLFSILGILVLFAVVKKNSILQIDHTNQLRAQGMPRHEAMLQANMDRLRPILMTTIAFVAGMIPLLVSNSWGSATYKAISAVIIGGQLLSLLLTLVATPVAYSLFDDVANSRIIRRLLRRPAAGAAALEEPDAIRDEASVETVVMAKGATVGANESLSAGSPSRGDR
jgi:hydrophobic/amphiphilic exporter-1 (mainly G- bacteria), HAE1 family